MKDLKLIVKSLANNTKQTWLQTLYTVVSSGAALANQIASAADSYITNYTALQTFDNAGQETTDTTRQNNSLVTLISKMSDIISGIRNAIATNSDQTIAIEKYTVYRLVTNYNSLEIRTFPGGVKAKLSPNASYINNGDCDFLGFISGMVASDGTNQWLCYGGNTFYQPSGSNLTFQPSRHTFPIVYRYAAADNDEALWFREFKVFVELNMSRSAAEDKTVKLWLHADLASATYYSFNFGALTWDEYFNIIERFMTNLNDALSDIADDYFNHMNSWTPPTTIRVGEFLSAASRPFVGSACAGDFVCYTQTSDNFKIYFPYQTQKDVRMGDITLVDKISHISEDYFPIISL